ncbi:TolB family protein [Deinococcus sp. UYEF24]
MRFAARSLGLLAAGLLGLTPATLAAAPSTPKAALTRVTSGGCCTGTAWTPDSRALLYIDRPPGAAKAAMYSVQAAGGAAPSVRFSRVAFYSPDLKYAAIPQGDSTVVERLSDQKRWTLNTQGAQLLWGTDGRVSYTVSAQSGNYDRRVSRVYALTLGTASTSTASTSAVPRLVATLYGGGAVAWLNSDTLLLSGKLQAASRDRQLFTLGVQSGEKRTLASALNLRGVQPSPDGRWVAYSVAFDRPERDGMFVQPTAGGPARKLNWFGSYQWRGSGSLLYIPLTLNVPTHTVRLYDLGTGQSRPLLNLGAKVQSGDWQVSPDGQKVAFRRAGDGNIYVAALP